MKKTALIFTLCSVIAACSNNNQSAKSLNTDSINNVNQSAKNQQTSADTNVNKIGTASTTLPNSEGAKLIAASDCLGCHKIDEKLVGPSYKSVAEKYPNTTENVDKLANKVIAGGSGVWGDIPMTPHPNLALNDAKEMVKYILSIK